MMRPLIFRGSFRERLAEREPWQQAMFREHVKEKWGRRFRINCYDHVTRMRKARSMAKKNGNGLTGR